MEFTCRETSNGISVHVAAHQGSFAPWWKNLQVEVYGSPASPSTASIIGTTEKIDTSFDAIRHATMVLIPDNGRGTDLQIEWAH
jgi:alpha-glucosidase